MAITPNDVRQQVAQLSNYTGSHKDQVEKYRSILQSILKSSMDVAEALKIFIEAIVNENVSLVISRQILTDITNQLTELDDRKSKFNFLRLTELISKLIAGLIQVHPRVISFEEQVTAIRQHLSMIYEREQNWREAASILVRIPLETG